MKRNKGITLIALIITIIVLLILAGITLNMVMGDSGIFSKANQASKETNEKQAIETVQLALLSARMEYTLNKGIDVEDFVEKENKEIKVDEIGSGEPLDYWEMTYNGYKFEVLDLKIKSISQGEDLGVEVTQNITEKYQFATTAGNKVDIELIVTVPEGAIVEQVTVTKQAKGTVDGEYKDGKYTGTITTNETENPNGDYEYEIKVTKEGKEEVITEIVTIEKFLDDPTIEIAEDSIKYDRFTIKVTNNYPTDAVKYKYYVTNTTADFETSTTKEITELDPETEYNVKVEAYLADEKTYKPAETTVTTPEKLVEIDSIEDLERINEDLAGSYKLTKSLDFKDRASYETDERYAYYTQDDDGDGNPDNSWSPLAPDEEPFLGVLNGNYYSIKNLYINSEEDYMGLISQAGNKAWNSILTDEGLIKNISLENVNIKSTGSIVGGLCGISAGKLERVKVTGNIERK